MALMTWTKNLEIGNKTIDEQHQKLIDLMNRVHASTVAGDSKTALGKVLDDMIDYTGFHFTFEEGLMKRAGFKELAAHQVEHRKFLDKARDLQAKFKAGRATVNIELMFFLRNWLREHILQSDMQFGVFLADKEKPATGIKAGCP